MKAKRTITLCGMIAAMVCAAPAASADEDSAKRVDPSVETLDLSGEWRIEDGRCEYSLAANVPGGVHDALLAAGKIADVYWGANETNALWVSRRDWTFARTFEVSGAFLAKREIILRVEDCDTFCTISVNGREVGRTTDRFQRYDFDVKPFLKDGRNTISGHFESPVRKADERRAEIGRPYPMSNVPWAKNQALVRKPAFSGGWDWGPELETMGFCGKVALIASDRPRINYVYTRQRFNDDLSHCTLTVFADLSDGSCVTNVVEIDDPPLWWPNGAGEQRFYTFAVDVNGEKVSRRIGLRKVEVLNERTRSNDGKDELSLVFRVNNRRLFMKGANWIPCDAYEGRQTPDKYRDLLQSARDANMNMIRVWGGGQYERDCFYDICDELGILLWHDMMCSCAVYPGDDAFLGEIRAELAHQLRRLRDHASIAMWCGDNECLGAIKWFDETKSDQDFYRQQWIRRSKMQGEMVALYDPDRTYWPSSPCCGPGDFGNAWKEDSKGDMHNWNVWHENKPFEDYYNYTPRFCSEFGYQSFPSIEVAETFATREQILARGPEFEWHQKNRGGNRRIRETMSRYFRIPEGAEAMLYLSQVQQAMAIRTAVEGWRRLMPRCMGTLYWQLNDVWPVASWSSLEYGGKWKHLHYHAKRFYKDVMVLAIPKDISDENRSSNLSSGDEYAKTWEVWVVNDLPVAIDATVSLELWTFGGDMLGAKGKDIKVPAGSSVMVEEFASRCLGFDLELDERFAKLRLAAHDEKGVEHLDDNELIPKRWKRLELEKAKIDVVFDGFKVTLSADRPTFFTWAEARGVKGEFDDNSFTLLPGEAKTIVFTPKDSTTAEKFRKSFSVTHLRETYR